MNLSNFQLFWEKIVEKGFRDYDSLTRPERVWFNVQGLLGQVLNGGLSSFYYNSGADRVHETIEDLVLLGKADIAYLLEKMNALFPDCDIANDFYGRNEIISSWDGKHDLLIEEMDREFFQKDADLEKTLDEYILKNKLTEA